MVELKKILDELSKKELIDFMLEYAVNHGAFANEIKLTFAQLDSDQELRKIKQMINLDLGDIEDYDYPRDSWGWIKVNTGSIWHEIRTRIKQGHFTLAFQGVEALYLKLLTLCEYQGECEISMEAEICLDTMEDIAKQVELDSDKKLIFESCLELMDNDDGKNYGVGYETQLLEIASILVTKDNFKEIEAAINLCACGYIEEGVRTVQLKIIRKIEGSKAANDFIKEYLHFPKIREIAYEVAMQEKDFARAETLCIDILVDEKQKSSYRISPWYHKLYVAYEGINDHDKLINLAEEITFSGDSSYYERLKQLHLKSSTWEAYYPTFLKKCKEELPSSCYMRILAKEDELKLLLEEVRKSPSSIYSYGELLAKDFRRDVEELFVKALTELAMKARKRKEYQSVRNTINHFTNAGFPTEAEQLIEDFKIKFANRPAFVDELGKYLGVE